MVDICSVKTFNYEQNYDLVYIIVRGLTALRNSGDPILSRGVQCKLLSPGDILFKKYLSLKRNGNWNIVTFENIYRPEFESQISESQEAQLMLQLLALADKQIALVCYCDSPFLCHRRVIGEMLENLGAEVRYYW